MPTSSEYYDILGISRGASADEIKAAYRKRARTLHPDVNKSADAPQRFAQVQQAYETLSDSTKRKQYDRFGTVPGAGSPGTRPQGMYNWSNVAGQHQPSNSFDFDFDDLSSLFSDVFGTQSRASRTQRRATRHAPNAPSKNITHDITIPFDLALRGGQHTLRIQKGSAVQTIEVTIPKGAADGTKLRIKGGGLPGSTAQTTGDLILMLNVSPHPLYTRTGLDLMVTLPLTIAEATLGCTVPMPTPTGAVELTVPPGTSSHSKLRLRGKGVVDAKGKTGDLYALVRIVTPDLDSLNKTQRDAIRKLGKLQPNPREDRYWNPEN